MTPKPWGLNHTFIFFCWAGLSREAWLCSMWHHSTQLNSLYFQEGASPSCKLALGIGGPLCGHPYPGGLSFLTELYWQPANQPSAPGVGNKIHPFPEARVRKLDGQSPAPFCPSSPDPDSRGRHNDSISLQKESHRILEIRLQASTVTYLSYRLSIHVFILKKLFWIWLKLSFNSGTMLK